MKHLIKIVIVCCVILLSTLACLVAIPGLGDGGGSVSPLALTVTAGAQILEQGPKTNTQATSGNEPASPEPTAARAYVRSKEEIAALSDEFNSVQVRDNWTIYRPLLGKYDLEANRGWLRITGTPKGAEGYNNVFGLNVSGGDVMVTAKVGGVMTEPTQGAWIGFSPADFHDNSRTVAIALDSYGFGYRVIMWECRNETFCVETTMLGQEKFKYPGSVYLRLTRRGKNIIGYYSSTGEDYIFVGESKGFPVATDQVVFGAGCMTCKNEFYALFDSIEFKAP